MRLPKTLSGMTRGWAWGNEAADGRVSDPAAACDPVAIYEASAARGRESDLAATVGSSTAQVPDARNSVEHRSLAVGMAVSNVLVAAGRGHHPFFAIKPVRSAIPTGGRGDTRDRRVPAGGRKRTDLYSTTVPIQQRDMLRFRLRSGFRKWVIHAPAFSDHQTLRICCTGRSDQ